MILAEAKQHLFLDYMWLAHFILDRNVYRKSQTFLSEVRYFKSVLKDSLSQVTENTRKNKMLTDSLDKIHNYS